MQPVLPRAESSFRITALGSRKGLDWVGLEAGGWEGPLGLAGGWEREEVATGMACYNERDDRHQDK